MKDETIESILKENRSFAPTKNFVDEAKLKESDFKNLRKKAEENYEEYWADLARNNIHWFKDFSETLDSSNAPNYQWFSDGELNVSYNCLDVHASTMPNKKAIIFESEDGEVQTFTYKELMEAVCVFSNGLIKLGIQPMDRVIIYMPMVPEAIIAMQACARIGAVHSVVFGGFSANALRDRINDAAAKIVITADGAYRGGKIIPLKESTDVALEQDCECIEHVVVLKRTNASIPMKEERDVWWESLIQGEDKHCDAVSLPSEHPLFILYTSGSTGKPKGIQHSSGGYKGHTAFFWWVYFACKINKSMGV